MILLHIYSGNNVSNLIRIACILYKILQRKHYGLPHNSYIIWN